ncbi:AAA family ATPase [Pseudoroseomonas wenyumeiae]
MLQADRCKLQKWRRRHLSGAAEADSTSLRALVSRAILMSHKGRINGNINQRSADYRCHRENACKLVSSPMLHPTEKRQKWILTSAGKGGTGKTSTSLNLAVCAAHAGYKVVLIDLDAQKSLSRWHQRRPEQAPEIFLWQGKMTDVTQAISEVGTLEDADLVIVDTPPGIDDYPRESRLLVKKLISSSFQHLPVLPT